MNNNPIKNKSKSHMRRVENISGQIHKCISNTLMNNLNLVLGLGKELNDRILAEHV